MRQNINECILAVEILEREILELILSDNTLIGLMLPNMRTNLKTTDFKVKLLRELEKKLGRDYLEDQNIISKRPDLKIHQFVEKDPFLALYPAAVHELINKGILRHSGGNSKHERGEYALTIEVLKRLKEKPNILDFYPSLLIRNKLQTIMNEITNEVYSLIDEAINCYNSRLYRPSIIILLLSLETFIDDILILLIQKSNRNSKFNSKASGALKSTKLEKKIDNFYVLLTREELQEWINDNFDISVDDLKFQTHLIRNFRNNLLHPKDNINNLLVSFSDNYIKFIAFYEIIINLMKIKNIPPDLLKSIS